MLSWLRIRDLAIVADLEIELRPGLNIITGETGAGKSLIVDALELLAGARAQSEIVRTGAEAAVIEAQIDLTGMRAHQERLAAWSSAGAGEAPDELVIRRIIRAEGRSRAFVNGAIATLGQLADLSQDLLEICSQHEHHALVDPAAHLACLDDFAGLRQARQLVGAAWHALHEAESAFDAASRQLRERAEREAVLRVQLDEINALKPTHGELDELDQEHGRLAHADRLLSGARHVEETLYARDGALVDQLARLGHQLGQITGLDPELDALAERLDQARTELEDLGRDFGRYSRSIVHDPARLAAVEERIGQLRRLIRRFGGSLDEVLAHVDRLREEMGALDQLEDRHGELEQARTEAASGLLRLASALSVERRRRADELGAAITAELRDLGMGEARVSVDVASLEPRAGGLDLNGARCAPTGLDRVELLIAPNRGETPRPLGKIASGGELSRSLLAIRRVLAARSPGGTQVFDEVDTGVGGAVAEAIGRKLAAVAAHHQVLCITHQPQIAAYADQHLHISKEVVDGRTRTIARVLDPIARVEELARMMGGIDVSDATRRAAHDLITAAQTFKQHGAD